MIKGDRIKAFGFLISFMLIAFVIVSSSGFAVADDASEGKGGEGSGGEVNDTNNESAYKPFVDPRILEKFESNVSEVRVMVNIRDASEISISARDSKEQQNIKDVMRKTFLENKTNMVLSKLSETEFKLRRRLLTGRGFSGNITREGLWKLANDSNVETIRLEGISHIQPTDGMIDAEIKEPRIVHDEVDSEISNITKNNSVKLATGIVRKSLFSRFLDFLKSLLKFR